MTTQRDITQLVNAWHNGDDEALVELTPLIYDELKRLARYHMSRESKAHTLQATALVNEAFIRLGDVRLEYKNRGHFSAMAARMMRRILVDHARRKKSVKRGGEQRDIAFDDDLVAADQSPASILDLDRALENLGEQDEHLSNVVELIFFGGLSYDEAADVLETSRTRLAEDLRVAKAWLRVRLAENADD